MKSEEKMVLSSGTQKYSFCGFFGVPVVLVNLRLRGVWGVGVSLMMDWQIVACFYLLPLRYLLLLEYKVVNT